MTKVAKTLTASSALILDAVRNHIDKTGCRQKAIAADAGVESNYLSMIKAGDRPSLARVSGFKYAMPELDENLLTATILCEQYPEESSQQAIIDMVAFLAEPVGLEKDLVDIATDLRETDGASGLAFPDKLPVDIREQIRRLVKEAVQRETRERMPDSE